jgi:hypothetical protein
MKKEVADIWVKATEMQLKYGAQVQVEQLYAQLQRDRFLGQRIEH